MSLKSEGVQPWNGEQSCPSGDEGAIKISEWRTSMAVPWVRLLTSTAGGHGSDTRSLAGEVPRAARYTKNKDF